VAKYETNFHSVILKIVLFINVSHITINISDWVFNIPNIYTNCDQPADECASLNYPVLHAFNHFVDAPNQITVTCTPGKRPDGLPDWVWSAESYEFRGFIPSCVDPTYCDKDPPVPFYDNTDYKKPPLGSLKYGDGEIVTYTCQNSSKCYFLRIQPIYNAYHRSTQEWGVRGQGG
jgi:hypothetical protein